MRCSQPQHTFTAGGLMYSLVSTTVKSISTKLLVSFCRKTSIWLTIDSFSSSTDLSFLIRANTYLARAAGSASHLRGESKSVGVGCFLREGERGDIKRTMISYRGSRWEVSQLLSSSCFSISIVLIGLDDYCTKTPSSGCSEIIKCLKSNAPAV